jgi:hypothetical protein
MDPSNYMTSTPLDQWQSFGYFDPKEGDQNQYTLPN